MSTAWTTTAPTDRPTWRGWFHVAAFLSAIPAGVLLILAAHDVRSTVGAAVYMTGLLVGFGTSATYHRLARSERARRIMQRLDHSAIFVLIAATYTPVCLAAMPWAWGIPILAVVWVGAAVGIVLKQVAFDRFAVLQTAIYPLLGWIVVIAAPVLVHRMTPVELILMVSGGVLYSSGIPVLVRERPDPWPETFGYHEIWHAFTVVAAGCHFAAIAMLVR